MKSYTHLYEICTSEQNRIRSVQSAKKSKRIRNIIKARHLSDAALAEKSRDWIINYEIKEHAPIYILDGISHKQRTIYVPTLEELIVQHCVVNALKPMFYKGMYEHSYASLPGRGSHKAKRVIEKWIRTDAKNVKYVLKMDIRHFFDSVPHNVLKAKLSKHIHDELMLDLLFKIIDATDEGIPLGFHTSQWLANWFLQGLDHYIKEQLQAAHYVRYMDDMVIFGSNKKALHKMRQAISEYLGKDLDFMGFRFYRDHTVLRRSIMYKASRKAKKLASKARPTVYDARQMLSYLGWIKSTDTYAMYSKWIKPYVNFRKLKRKVSKSDKNNPLQIYYRLARVYQT